MTDKIPEKENVKDLDKFATFSLRGPKKTAKSQMYMIKTLKANQKDNLWYVKKIAKLAYFAKPDIKSKKLNIDFDIVEVVYAVSNALLSAKKNYYYLDRTLRLVFFPVCWGFPLTLQNFRRYILPWLGEIDYHHILCFNYESYKIRETLIFCPYCETKLLTTKQTTKKDAIDQFKQKLTDFFEEKTEALISEEEIQQRNSNEVALGYYRVYRPPRWEASYIKCPSCENKIRLNFKFFRGSHAGFYPPIEPPEFETREPVFEKQEYYDPTVQVKQFNEASSVLTEKGYNQLINSFLIWVEPYVSNFEFEILKLIDPETLGKWLDRTGREKGEENADSLD